MLGGSSLLLHSIKAYKCFQQPLNFKPNFLPSISVRTATSSTQSKKRPSSIESPGKTLADLLLDRPVASSKATREMLKSAMDSSISVHWKSEKVMMAAKSYLSSLNIAKPEIKNWLENLDFGEIKASSPADTSTLIQLALGTHQIEKALMIYFWSRKHGIFAEHHEATRLQMILSKSNLDDPTNSQLLTRLNQDLDEHYKAPTKSSNLQHNLMESQQLASKIDSATAPTSNSMNSASENSVDWTAFVTTPTQLKHANIETNAENRVRKLPSSNIQFSDRTYSNPINHSHLYSHFHHRQNNSSLLSSTSLSRSKKLLDIFSNEQFVPERVHQIRTEMIFKTEEELKYISLSNHLLINSAIKELLARENHRFAEAILDRCESEGIPIPMESLTMFVLYYGKSGDSSDIVDLLVRMDRLNIVPENTFLEALLEVYLDKRNMEGVRAIWDQIMISKRLPSAKLMNLFCQVCATCAEHGRDSPVSILDLFQKSYEWRIDLPRSAYFNLLVVAASKSGLSLAARLAFDRIPDPSDSEFALLLNSHTVSNDFSYTDIIFWSREVKGIPPNSSFITALVDACLRSNSFQQLNDYVSIYKDKYDRIPDSYTLLQAVKFILDANVPFQALNLELQRICHYTKDNNMSLKDIEYIVNHPTLERLEAATLKLTKEGNPSKQTSSVDFARSKYRRYIKKLIGTFLSDSFLNHISSKQKSDEAKTSVTSFLDSLNAVQSNLQAESELQKSEEESTQRDLIDGNKILMMEKKMEKFCYGSKPKKKKSASLGSFSYIPSKKKISSSTNHINYDSTSDIPSGKVTRTSRFRYE